MQGDDPKQRVTHLAPHAYAHLKAYAVLSGNWQIGSIWKIVTAGGGGAGRSALAPFDTDKIKTNGNVGSLDEAKAQFKIAWDKWLEWFGPGRASRVGDNKKAPR